MASTPTTTGHLRRHTDQHLDTTRTEPGNRSRPTGPGGAATPDRIRRRAASIRLRIPESRFDRQRPPRKPLVAAGPILIAPRRGHLKHGQLLFPWWRCHAFPLPPRSSPSPWHGPATSSSTKSCSAPPTNSANSPTRPRRIGDTRRGVNRTFGTRYQKSTLSCSQHQWCQPQRPAGYRRDLESRQSTDSGSWTTRSGRIRLSAIERPVPPTPVVANG